MTFKILATLFFGLGFSLSGFAAETCINTASELAAKKSEFPKFLQENPPVLFTRDKFPVTALSFRIVDNKIVGEAVYKILFGIKKDSGYVKRICYNGTDLKVTLEVQKDGGKESKDFNVKMLSDSVVSVKGFELKKSSPAEFASVLDQLVKKEKGSTRGSLPAESLGKQ